MKLSTKPAFWLAFLLLTIPAACCSAQDAFPTNMMGPADLRNQRPYQLIFLAFSPEAATVLDNGQSKTSLQFDLADDLLIPKVTNGVTVHEQTETQRLALSDRRGLGNGLEASIDIPVIARDGGIMDKLIANYHDLIGDTHTTPDDAIGRDHVTPYHSDVYFTRPNGADVVDLQSTAGLGDTQLTLKKSLWASGSTAAAIRAGLKLPTGSASKVLGSGAVDGGLDLDLQASLSSRWALFGNGSYVWMGKDDTFDGYAQRHMAHGAFAIEYYASTHTSWVLQNDLGQAGVKTGNNFADGAQGTVSLAYKFATPSNTLWTYAFSENGGVVADRASWVANVGPDPTFSVGWARYY